MNYLREICEPVAQFVPLYFGQLFNTVSQYADGVDVAPLLLYFKSCIAAPIMNIYARLGYDPKANMFMNIVPKEKALEAIIAEMYPYGMSDCAQFYNQFSYNMSIKEDFFNSYKECNMEAITPLSQIPVEEKRNEHTFSQPSPSQSIEASSPTNKAENGYSSHFYVERNILKPPNKVKILNQQELWLDKKGFRGMPN
jgi:hypothetical protein